MPFFFDKLIVVMEGNKMGDVYAEFTLRNEADIILARCGHIPEKNIRTATITALVDTGAHTLVMNETLREELGLAVVDSQTIILADGSETPCGITEPVEVRWEDRTACVRAWVVPDEGMVLMGVIPLEEMELIVDPNNQRLVRPQKRRIGTGYMRIA